LTQHTAKAEHNELVASQLAAGKSAYDWAVIALFYAALHLVDDQASRKNLHHTGHKVRARFVFEEWPDMQPAYVALHQSSEQARYECGLMGPGDATKAQQSMRKIVEAIKAKPVA